MPFLGYLVATHLEQKIRMTHVTKNLLMLHFNTASFERHNNCFIMRTQTLIEPQVPGIRIKTYTLRATFFQVAPNNMLVQ
jgi:hypothetical protein